MNSLFAQFLFHYQVNSVSECGTWFTQ